MRWVLLASVAVLWSISSSVFSASDRGLPPGVTDTQDPKDVPTPAQEAVRAMRAPAGFRVELFASEPEVAQPIAMAFDDRGRLWVAECYSYPDWLPEERRHLGRDRIVIFEDTDGDGRWDRRKVFWDRAYNLTSIEIGYGGVWALCIPHLLFIPDRDGDDRPDGPPEVLLDGWSLLAKHNAVNGLTWGPDGWLWGRHGITWESRVGVPGTAPDQRVRLSCSIWRFHPQRRLFEVVAHGTTNPWGLDFDDFGEAFMTNNVLGHLWHVVPGARYQRMFGQDLNPYAYELLGPTSDHLHWAGGDWQSARGGQVHDQLGGGHSHAGGMIYLGDNWPDAYRNLIFMCNTHGRRINCDRLERQGCGYVGRHRPDFLRSDDPWFRGVCLTYGPDGTVYLADWCDLGECHDHDGVHRSSGRIYRIVYGQPPRLRQANLADRSDAELVRLQTHKNDWYVRHARRLLAERAARGQAMSEVHKLLRDQLTRSTKVPLVLRALWALYVTGGASFDDLLSLLDHPSEHVRAWAVRLLVDPLSPAVDPPAGLVARLTKQARDDRSGLVRLYLASALQRLPLAQRWPLARALAARVEDVHDRCQPLLLWYGIEPAVPAWPEQAVQLASTTPMAPVRRFVFRRLAEATPDDAVQLEKLLTPVLATPRAQYRRDMLEGLLDGFKGRSRLPASVATLQALAELRLRAMRDGSGAHTEMLLALHLAALFDDPAAWTQWRALLADRRAPGEVRRTALEVLAHHKDRAAQEQLPALLEEPELRGAVIRALGTYGWAQTPQLLLQKYASLSDEEKRDAVATLASRREWARALLDAVERGAVPRADISAYIARQLLQLGDPHIAEKVQRVWGQVRRPAAEKHKLIEHYRRLLTPQALAQADRSRGRQLFLKTCGTCHRLFGEGQSIGPDLTGSNRNDLFYLLENIVDPNAVISQNYHLTTVVTTQGRVVSGIVVEESAHALTLQTASERVVLAKKDIEDRQTAQVSLMPEGLLDPLTPDEVAALIAYVQSSASTHQAGAADGKATRP